MSSYQNNLNTQIKQNVDKINKYGNQLLTLNDQIRAIESGGIEHANDLRDARNQILDELAELTNMTFSEDRYGSVSVQIEGVDFVKDGTCYEIALKTDEATGFVTPFWPMDATYTVRMTAPEIIILTAQRCLISPSRSHRIWELISAA